MANWLDIQANSESILASGIRCLQDKAPIQFEDVSSSRPGNYLIANGTHSYVGEAKNLRSRLRQQSKPNTSTFFKNYQKIVGEIGEDSRENELNSFEVRLVETNLGRKEIEEFGIVNIPATLNRFQLDKRRPMQSETTEVIWRDIQQAAPELLGLALNDFLEIELVPWFDANPANSPEIYRVCHPVNGEIYIGESSSLHGRWKAHSKDTYFSALRRHIGEFILGFRLHSRKGKKRYFDEDEDRQVTEYLRAAKISVRAISIGRFELEEQLIRSRRPLLNRKENISKIRRA